MKINKLLFIYEVGEEITPPVDVPVEKDETVTEEPVPQEPVITEPTESVKEEEVVVDSNVEELTKTNSELKSELEKKLAEIEQLKSEIQNKATEITKENETLTSLENEKNKAINDVATYEKVISDLVESKMEIVPENIKDLVPNGTTIEKLAWLNKAEKSGLFGKVIQTEIGKPMNPAKAKEEVDISNMSSTSLLSMAYGSQK